MQEAVMSNHWTKASSTAWQADAVSSDLTECLTRLIDATITQQQLLQAAWQTAEKHEMDTVVLNRLAMHSRMIQQMRTELLSLLSRVPMVEMIGGRLIDALQQTGWITPDSGSVGPSATGSRAPERGGRDQDRKRKRYRLLSRTFQTGTWELNGEIVTFEAEVYDVSESGIGFFSTHALPRGAVVHLPFMLGTVQAMVHLRVQHCKRTEDSRYRVGGIFTYATWAEG